MENYSQKTITILTCYDSGENFFEVSIKLLQAHSPRASCFVGPLLNLHEFLLHLLRRLRHSSLNLLIG